MCEYTGSDPVKTTWTCQYRRVKKSVCSMGRSNCSRPGPPGGDGPEEEEAAPRATAHLENYNTAPSGTAWILHFWTGFGRGVRDRIQPTTTKDAGR